MPFQIIKEIDPNGGVAELPDDLGNNNEGAFFLD